MKPLNLYESKWLYKGIGDCGKFDFPEPIVRVTAGAGGEALLIFGSEKTALLDCGMAYCADTLISNIHAALENAREKVVYEEKSQNHPGNDCEHAYQSSRKHFTLDYIIATHTHYDHIGALSAVKTEWPDAVTCASEYAATVFHREGAIAMIQKMSNIASRDYQNGSEVHLDFEKMHVDRIVHDGDRIILGKESLLVLETPGHTNCSLSFALEPQRILFLSESTGVLQREDLVESQILKSYSDARISIEKCRSYDANRLIIPHSGIIPRSFHDDFWRMTIENMEQKRKFAADRRDTMTEQEIIQDYIRTCWDEERGKEQTYAAYCENAKYEMHAALKDLER